MAHHVRAKNLSNEGVCDICSSVMLQPGEPVVKLYSPILQKGMSREHQSSLSASCFEACTNVGSEAELGLCHKASYDESHWLRIATLTRPRERVDRVNEAFLYL